MVLGAGESWAWLKESRGVRLEMRSEGRRVVQMPQAFDLGSESRGLSTGVSQGDIFKRVSLPSEFRGVDFFFSNEFISLKTK